MPTITPSPPPIRPDLSRLTRAQRREIQQYCSAKLVTDWRLWALTLALALPAMALPMVSGTVFRQHGIWLVIAGGAVGGLVMGVIVGRVVERFAAPHLAAELRRRGLCPRCAYDTRATPDHCPECGVSLASNTLPLTCPPRASAGCP